MATVGTVCEEHVFLRVGSIQERLQSTEGAACVFLRDEGNDLKFMFPSPIRVTSDPLSILDFDARYILLNRTGTWYFLTFSFLFFFFFFFCALSHPVRSAFDLLTVPLFISMI